MRLWCVWGAWKQCRWHTVLHGPLITTISKYLKSKNMRDLKNRSKVICQYEPGRSWLLARKKLRAALRAAVRSSGIASAFLADCLIGNPIGQVPPWYFFCTPVRWHQDNYQPQCPPLTSHSCPILVLKRISIHLIAEDLWKSRYNGTRRMAKLGINCSSGTNWKPSRCWVMLRPMSGTSKHFRPGIYI